MSPAMTSDVSIDVYAHTNPAYWALALSRFVVGYEEATNRGQGTVCAFPLLFLPMPLAFSREARLRFERTNKKTGLMTWLQRHPSIRATIGAEIVVAKPYTRRALTFALAHNLLSTFDGW